MNRYNIYFQESRLRGSFFCINKLSQKKSPAGAGDKVNSAYSYLRALIGLRSEAL